MFAFVWSLVNEMLNFTFCAVFTNYNAESCVFVTKASIFKVQSCDVLQLTDQSGKPAHEGAPLKRGAGAPLMKVRFTLHHDLQVKEPFLQKTTMSFFCRLCNDEQ